MMTIHDRGFVQSDDQRTENLPSRDGCEKLPAMKVEAAEIEAFIERATSEIESIEGKLRARRARPGSPERDRELTPLGDKLANLYNERGRKTRELSRLMAEIQNLESRCIKQA